MIDHSVVIETDIPLPATVTNEALTSLVQYVLSAEAVEEPWEIGIQFVDDLAMQQAHVDFMGIDEPTDIMTFPYADEGEAWGGEESGGDLMISVDRARANAADVGWSHEEELLFVVIHGLLHLTGWDDHDEADRNAMLDRQRLLLHGWTAPQQGSSCRAISH